LMCKRQAIGEAPEIHGLVWLPSRVWVSLP
jgi:hypothetical protein